MSPGILSDNLPLHSAPGSNGTTERPIALKQSGALETFQYEDTTPVIGREFIGVNIVDDLMNASNADQLLRDLAITISERGVVFFRAQDNLTNDLQKQLNDRLGRLTGKPQDSTLHIHPVLNNTSEFGVGDAQISHISSEARNKMFRHERQADRRKFNAPLWHSDIQFEPHPADYTSLRLTKLPTTGGDTLWASGYEIYDRFSPAYQGFFDTLTADFIGDGFIQAARADPENVKIFEEPRGHPKNVGRELKATHPVVRMSKKRGKEIQLMVSLGWKSIFAIGPFPKRINELTPEESDDLLHKFNDVIYRNHDLTVRFKWRNPNDIAIWDNRSAFHTATFDYDGLGERFGHRAVGIGEAPYLDPNSTSRSDALGLL